MVASFLSVPFTHTSLWHDPDTLNMIKNVVYPVKAHYRLISHAGLPVTVLLFIIMLCEVSFLFLDKQHTFFFLSFSAAVYCLDENRIHAGCAERLRKRSSNTVHSKKYQAH